MQEIKLDKHIKLLDSPGIVMSKDENLASLALKNCVKVLAVRIKASFKRSLKTLILVPRSKVWKIPPCRSSCSFSAAARNN